VLLKVILGDGAVVCGLPVVFESLCEKKGGGPDGQRNWFKGGRRNWKARHLRLTSRWLQYLDAPLPAGVLKGSKEICPEWTVSYNSKHANAIVIECSGEEVLNVRFASQEVEPAAAPLSRLSHVIFSIYHHLQLCREWKDILEETASNSKPRQRQFSSFNGDASLGT
jgi:hypothetical protein